MNTIYNVNDEPLFTPEINAKNEEEREKMRFEFLRRQMDLKDTFLKTPEGMRSLIFLLHELYVFRTVEQYNASAYGILAKQAVGNELMSILGVEEVLNVFKKVKKQESKDV